MIKDSMNNLNFRQSCGISKCLMSEHAMFDTCIVISISTIYAVTDSGVAHMICCETFILKTCLPAFNANYF